MEIFWKTIAYYNSATWIYQLLIIVAGLLLTVMLIKNPRPWVKMGMKLYMIFLYLWIAIAYYAICCDERSYNGALAMFWGGYGHDMGMGCHHRIYYFRTYI